MTDALRYLLARRLPAPRPWELGALALCCAVPSALLALLAPDSLPDAQVVARWGALVALPLYWTVRTTGLGVAMRRGGSLDEVYGAGMQAGDLLAGLSLLGAGRAAVSGLACALGLAAGALLLPADLRGDFLGSALLLPVVVAFAALLALCLGLAPVVSSASRTGARPPARARADASEQENPVLFRESLRPSSPVLSVVAGLAAGALGMLVADEKIAFWGGLAGVWLVLLGASALRASAAFAMERETRSLEALLATRTQLDEFLDGWVRAAVAPVRALSWFAVAVPLLGLLEPRNIVPDGPIYGVHEPAASFLVPFAAVALASLIGGLAAPAGAWLGLWASAGAPDRSHARGRLLGGLAGLFGAVLLGWALLVFPTGIAMERLRVAYQMQQWWETAALLFFPLLSAIAALGGLAFRGRSAVGPLVEGAWRSGVAPLPVGPVRAWITGAVLTLWTPGRLLLVPAAAVALTLIWRTDRGSSHPPLGEMVFMMLLMAGLGLFSSGTLWALAWKPAQWLWEGVARRGWPLGRSLGLGLVGGAVASGSVVVALLAFPSSYADEAQWLALGPLLGAVITLREWLARR